MKKKYINPEISIMKVKTPLMQTASTIDVKSGSATEWGSRQGSLFFDDDLDEDF